MTTTKIIVAHCTGPREVEHVTCDSPEEARRVIEEGAATAAPQWNWRLANINFLTDNGTDMPVEQANEIRRACGCTEY